MKNKNGFTLVELIIAITVVGIIAVVGSSRFLGTSSFSDRANADKVKFLLKIGQKAAMAQRRNIYVIQSGSIINLCYTNSSPCPTNQMITLNNKIFNANVGSTTIVLPSISFNSLGSAGTSKLTVKVGQKNIYVEPESGYVHE